MRTENIQRIITDQRFFEIVKALQDDGHPIIGTGAYSTVFMKKNTSDRVIKIGQDPAYFEYAKLAMDNSQNPWYPKIYSITIYEIHRLAPCNCQHPEKPPVYMPNVYVYMYEMEKLDENTSAAFPLCEHFKKTNCPNILKTFVDLKMMQYRTSFRDLYGVRRALMKLYSKHREDIHDKNILFRGMQPVISDPIY